MYLAPSTSPGDLQVTVVSSTALHLSWTAPHEDRNGIIREYRVKVHEIETSQLRMYSTVNSFITVQSLHPFYTYRCAVSAFTVATGPFANFSVVMLPEDGNFFLLLSNSYLPPSSCSSKRISSKFRDNPNYFTIS